MRRLVMATAVLAAGWSFAGAIAQEQPAGASPAELEHAFERRAAAGGRTVDRATTGSVTKAQARKPRKRGRETIELTTVARVKELGPRKDGGTSAARVANVAYGALISRYAATYGVPLSLAQAVVRVESNFRPDARGSAGEIGLMQIKHDTARMMGYTGSAKGLFHPETNIKYGMKYLALAQQLGGGSTCGTILKYNAGHGARRMNDVSAAYCAKVKRHLSS